MKWLVKISWFLCGVLILSSSFALPVNYEFHGIQDGPAYKNVEAVLKNLKKKLHNKKTLTDTTTITDELDDRITEAVKPYGYFNAKVQTTATLSNDTLNLSTNIHLGPIVRVKKVDIVIQGTAKNDPSFIALEKKFTPAINSPLNTANYDTLKTQLYNLAAAQGYFDATMTKSQIIINRPLLQATIIIHFNSGDRYRFNRITIGQSTYDEHYIKKFIEIKPNQYYSMKDIDQSKKNLINTNSFNNVVIQTHKKNRSRKTVDANITLQEKKPKQFLLGAGYGTDTGIRGTIGAHFRHLTDNGQQLDTLLQASQENNSFTATYRIPGNNPVSQQNLISAGIGHIDQDTGTSDVQKVSFSRVTTKNYWHRILAVNALDENYNITDLPKTDTHMIYPSINWARRKANGVLNPSYGLATVLNLSGTPSFLSSQDSGFSQIRLDSTYLTSFSNKATRLLLRNSIGRTEIDNLSSLPLSLQLFAGGSRSIRGYGYNSIGPGRNLFTGTFEIQKAFPHSQSWYVAAFIDAGNVSDQNLFDDVKSSVGPGIVWLSPLGMMELNLAFPLPKEDHGIHFDFSMGPAL
ncbi:MAG: hypothetical protein CMF55_02930 [Legionellales bacterium]|nr:hypothetical protein [Legionellales bacterium]